MFKKGLRPKCELEDVDACTVYFQGLLGSKGCVEIGQGPEMLGSWSPSEAATPMLDDADREFLNAPLMREELCAHIKTCKGKKAADLEGMTAESLQ